MHPKSISRRRPRPPSRPKWRASSHGSSAPRPAAANPCPRSSAPASPITISSASIPSRRATAASPAPQPKKALAQTVGRPTLTATILAKRKGYYEALAGNNKDNEIAGWLAWFAAAVIEAQRRAIGTADFLIDASRLFERVDARLNNRRRKALRCMVRAGPDGLAGGLSAGKYINLTGASPATTTRDLADLVASGALLRTGERRHARYQIAIQLRPIAPMAI
jgi:hypothetical protein